MRDTTQAQLLQLAKKHEGNKAVKTIVNLLTEAQSQAKFFLESLQRSAGILTKSASLEEGYSVGWTHSELVTTAANANSELAKMSAHFATLASVLISLGEEVSY